MNKIVPLPIPETAEWLEWLEDDGYLQLNKEFIALRKKLHGKTHAEAEALLNRFFARWRKRLIQSLSQAVLAKLLGPEDAA